LNDSERLFGLVLLVEDDQSHAFLIKRALKDYAQEIVLAPTVKVALEQLAVQRPDLIISDLNLPDSSGVNHIPKLLQAGADAPVIVLTSSTNLRDAVEAMKVGARDFIVKNFGTEFSESLGVALSRVMATMHLEAERRRLEKEMGVLRVAIENSNDGLAVINSHGLVDYSNTAFRNFMNSCGSSDYSNLLSIFSDRLTKHETLKDSIVANLEGLSTGAVWQTEILFRDRKERAYSLSLSVIDREGDRFVVWVKDISEDKRREKFQREILSTTTHDLKGPLGAIMLSSEMLVDLVKDREKAQTLALRIGSSAQGAINLIDEFLSARRLQEGNFILRPTVQDMRELVKEVLGNYDAIAASRSIETIVKFGQGDLSACVDRLGFARVLGNLVSNALKFTPKGGRLLVEVEKSSGELQVKVQDNGSGMEPSDVQKIFERFSRLTKHSEVAGTGLGLFVVKSIVSAHGGKIEVTSKVGQGTTFYLFFPENPPVNERGELISLDFA